MIYRRLTVSGFGPYQNPKSWSFPEGLTMITGKNGTGKSTIIDAIHWALYGPRASLRSSKDRSSIIFSRSQSAKVTLELEQDDHYVSITRGLNRGGKHSLSLSIDDEPVEGNITQIQSDIDSVLGVDSEVFTATCMITSSSTTPMNTFLVATPADKKEILSHIVDPDGVWESANKTMRKRSREEKDVLVGLRAKEEMVSEMISSLDAPDAPEVDGDLDELTTAKRRLEKTIADSGGADDLHRSETISSEIRDAKSRRSDLADDIESMESRLSDVEKRIDSSSKKIDELDSTLIRISDRIFSLDSEIACGEELLDYLQETLDDGGIDDLTDKQCKVFSDVLSSHQIACPSCHTVLPADLLGDRTSEQSEHHDKTRHIRDLDEYVTSLEDKRDRLVTSKSEAKKDRKRNVEILDESTREMKSIESRLDEMDESSDKIDARIKRLNKEKESTHDEDLSKISEQLEEVTADIDALRAYDHRMAAYREREEDLSEQLAEICADIDDQQVVVDHFVSLVALTSPDGEISTQITDLCNKIGSRATTAMEDAYGLTPDVKVVAGKDVVIRVNDRDLSSFSHGQQSRIIPAILSGLTQEVYARRGVFLPPLWDEPSIAVDREDVEKMISMVSGDSQALVIMRDISTEVDNKIVAEAPAVSGL